MTAILRDPDRRMNREERRQREWELTQALGAARSLQARLEMLGDRRLDVLVTVTLRHDLARELARLADVDEADGDGTQVEL